MKCLGDGPRVYIKRSVKRSILSSTRRRAASNPIFKKLFPSSAFTAFMILGVLLAALTLSPMRRLFTPGGSVTAFDETIATFDLSTCAGSATAKTTYDLGDNAWATVMNAPLPDPTFNTPQRHFQWIAPDFTIAQQADITTATACDRYSIPSTGAFAQVGTWIVRTVDSNFNGVASTRFVVRDPNSLRADVSVSKFGPAQVTAGTNLTYSVQVTNNGPDTADSVTLTDITPANTTFVSTDVPSCTDPSAGCNIGSLAPGVTAVFTIVYSVNSGTPAGTLITNTAVASSTTAEPSALTQVNNSGSSVTTVASPPPTTCTISCPSDITVDNNPNDANPCVAMATYTTPGATGNCVDPESNTTPPVSCSPASGSFFPVGATTVTCSIQAATCSFTVTVNDTRPPSPPMITCPAGITVNESPTGSGQATVSYSTPNATGNCVTVACSPPSGSRFNAGSTTVTCTATGSSNPPASCQFTVTVTTGTCRLDCPDDITVNESSPTSNSAMVTYSTPVPVGPCPPSLTITCTPASGHTFQVGVNPVSCTAEDSPNNVVATCGFTVTVNSLPDCSITCPDPVSTPENPSGSGHATVSYAPTTNCATFSCNPPSGYSFPIGTTTVHCTGTDPAGNTNSCSFTVTVTGGTPCVITCPSSFTIGASSGCGNFVTYSNPTTTGSCGGDPSEPPFPPIPTCNPPSGSFFPAGTVNVICTTDVGTQCSFPVTIAGTDDDPPVITSCGPATFALADANSQGVVPNVTGDVEATDNCTPTNLLTITQNPAPGTLAGSGTITVTVTDAKGNSSTCTTTFTVCAFESIPPTARCKDITVVLNASGNASITGTDVDNVSTDNCGIASRTVSPSTFTCANKGPNTVTLTVSDPSGNIASCQAIVTVVDNIPPTITCPANVVQSTDANQCTAVVTYSNATAADNCPGVGTPACSPASGSPFPKGTTIVNCTVSDASSNPASCSFTVMVNDTQPPTARCKDITVNLSATSPGTVTVNAADINDGSTDNCGVTQLLIDGAASKTFTCSNQGANMVTLTVKDASNNTATCTATVTVKDITPPVISCSPPGNLTFEPTCPAGAVVTYSNPVASDNCGVLSVVCSPASGSTFSIGTTTVTCTATDTATPVHNSSNCIFTVHVKTAAEVIQDLITRVQALQPPLAGQQSQGLVSKLQAALDAVNQGKTNVACNKLADFISQVQAYIGNGTLTSAQGQPLINSAANLRNTLGCTNLACS